MFPAISEVSCQSTNRRRVYLYQIDKSDLLPLHLMSKIRFVVSSTVLEAVSQRPKPTRKDFFARCIPDKKEEWCKFFCSVPRSTNPKGLFEVQCRRPSYSNIISSISSTSLFPIIGIIGNNVLTLSIYGYHH